MPYVLDVCIFSAIVWVIPSLMREVGSARGQGHLSWAFLDRNRCSIFYYVLHMLLFFQWIEFIFFIFGLSVCFIIIIIIITIITIIIIDVVVVVDVIIIITITTVTIGVVLVVIIIIWRASTAWTIGTGISSMYNISPLMWISTCWIYVKFLLTRTQQILINDNVLGWMRWFCSNSVSVYTINLWLKSKTFCWHTGKVSHIKLCT